MLLCKMWRRGAGAWVHLCFPFLLLNNTTVEDLLACLRNTKITVFCNLRCIVSFYSVGRMCNHGTHFKISVNRLSAFLANILNLRLNVEIKELETYWAANWRSYWLLINDPTRDVVFSHFWSTEGSHRHQSPYEIREIFLCGSNASRPATSFLREQIWVRALSP